MYRIDATVEGLAPLLFNRMVTELDGPKAGKMTEEERRALAEQKVYCDEQGLYWPAWNLKVCIVDGCKRAGIKEGRGSMAPFLMATVFPETPRFDKTERDYLHEVVGRIPPKTGAAAMIRRPCLNAGWHLSFALNVVDDRRNPNDIRTAVDSGGLLVGLGSWRPEYGRFRVTEWQVSKM